MFKYDKAFVAKATAAKQKEELTSGRGSKQKVLVVATAESTVLEDLKQEN